MEKTLCCLLLLSSVVQSRDVLEVISMEADLTEFYNLIQLSETVKTALRYAEVTVFAPTDSAWRKRGGGAAGRSALELLSYHLVKSPVTSDRFPASLSSEALGGVPIWVTRRENPFGVSSKPLYHANNAEIVRADIKGQSMEGAEQVLHVIDEVLEPTVPQSDDPNFKNPSAFRYISNPSVYGASEELYGFSTRVNQFRKTAIFQAGEGHTFFVPVDGTSSAETWNRVDDKVIDAHVVPDKVFFVRAFPPELQETLSFDESVKVVVKMRNESIDAGRGYELSVESNTLVGNQLYHRGTVVARIVRPNVPVKNGVVHLIENPLVVIDKNVAELLRQNPQLSQFYDIVQKFHPELLNKVQQFESTVFAPNNEAFRHVDPSRLQMVYSDENRVKRMLELHVSPQKVTTEQVVQGTSSIPTLDPTRKLHLQHSSKNVTVVGGGVNASIVTPDVGALNGIIQIIDNVLGVPFRTIYEVLELDAGLSDTFLLGKQGNYNEKFRNLDRVYTYFVPNDEAWSKMRSQFPLEYSQLFGGQFSAQARNVLNRHMIDGKEYSLQDLLRLGTPVDTSGGKIDFFESNGRNYLRWESETAEVVEADVDSSNGKVHVIGKVLFTRKDVSTAPSRATTLLPVTTLQILSFIFLTRLTWF